MVSCSWNEVVQFNSTILHVYQRFYHASNGYFATFLLTECSLQVETFFTNLHVVVCSTKMTFQRIIKNEINQKGNRSTKLVNVFVSAAAQQH